MAAETAGPVSAGTLAASPPPETTRGKTHAPQSRSDMFAVASSAVGGLACPAGGTVRAGETRTRQIGPRGSPPHVRRAQTREISTSEILAGRDRAQIFDRARRRFDRRARSGPRSMESYVSHHGRVYALVPSSRPFVVVAPSRRARSRSLTAQKRPNFLPPSSAGASSAGAPPPPKMPKRPPPSVTFAGSGSGSGSGAGVTAAATGSGAAAGASLGS